MPRVSMTGPSAARPSRKPSRSGAGRPRPSPRPSRPPRPSRRRRSGVAVARAGRCVLTPRAVPAHPERPRLTGAECRLPGHGSDTSSIGVGSAGRDRYRRPARRGTSGRSPPMRRHSDRPTSRYNPAVQPAQMLRIPCADGVRLRGRGRTRPYPRVGVPSQQLSPPGHGSPGTRCARNRQASHGPTGSCVPSGAHTSRPSGDVRTSLRSVPPSAVMT
jgi:hypothetical protein